MSSWRGLAFQFLLLMAAFAAVYSLGFKEAEIEHQKQLRERLEEVNREHAAQLKKAQAVEHKIVAVERQQTEKAKAIRNEIQTENETPGGCIVPSNTVRLLELARHPDLPLSPSNINGESPTPPSIGVRDLAIVEADTADRYNRLANRFNELVAWIEENYESEPIE